jgi:hypothetical protein
MRKATSRGHLDERLDGAHSVRVIALGVTSAKVVSTALVLAYPAVIDHMRVRTWEAGERVESAIRSWAASGCAGRKTACASGAGGASPSQIPAPLVFPFKESMQRLIIPSRGDAQSGHGEKVKVESGRRQEESSTRAHRLFFSSCSLALSISAPFLDRSSANGAGRATTASTIHSWTKRVRDSALNPLELIDYSALPTLYGLCYDAVSA